MTSLMVLVTSASRASRKSSVNRSSAAISRLLDVDRVFRAVQCGQAGVVLLARRDRAVTEHGPVALVVVTEQAGRQVVAPAVALTALGIDPHLHRAAPVCAVPPGLRADIRRVSSASHSWSPTSWRSGVTSALPIA